MNNKLKKKRSIELLEISFKKFFFVFEIMKGVFKTNLDLNLLEEMNVI